MAQLWGEEGQRGELSLPGTSWQQPRRFAFILAPFRTLHPQGKKVVRWLLTITHNSLQSISFDTMRSLLVVVVVWTKRSDRKIETIVLLPTDKMFASFFFLITSSMKSDDTMMSRPEETHSRAESSAQRPQFFLLHILVLICFSKSNLSLFLFWSIVNRR